MLLAGGQGSRLHALTSHVAKPAVPFGGKYRIIDFPLSNCTNSGIDTVGVLTQYRPLELNSYIGSGQPWELDRLNGGVHILPPYQSASGASWYKGTAGFAMSPVRTYRRLPCPPASSMATHSFFMSVRSLQSVGYALLLLRRTRPCRNTAPRGGTRRAMDLSRPWDGISSTGMGPVLHTPEPPQAASSVLNTSS